MQVNFLGLWVVELFRMPELVVKILEVFVIFQLWESPLQVYCRCFEWSIVDNWKNSLILQGLGNDSLPELLVGILFEEEVIDDVEESGVVLDLVDSLLQLLLKLLMQFRVAYVPHTVRVHQVRQISVTDRVKALENCGFKVVEGLVVSVLTVFL